MSSLSPTVWIVYNPMVFRFRQIPFMELLQYLNCSILKHLERFPRILFWTVPFPSNHVLHKPVGKCLLRIPIPPTVHNLRDNLTRLVVHNIRRWYLLLSSPVGILLVRLQQPDIIYGIDFPSVWPFNLIGPRTHFASVNKWSQHLVV